MPHLNTGRPINVKEGPLGLCAFSCTDPTVQIFGIPTRRVSWAEKKYQRAANYLFVGFWAWAIDRPAWRSIYSPAEMGSRCLGPSLLSTLALIRLSCSLKHCTKHLQDNKRLRIPGSVSAPSIQRPLACGPPPTGLGMAWVTDLATYFSFSCLVLFLFISFTFFSFLSFSFHRK